MPKDCSEQTARSVCPYDCPDTCGLLVTILDGKVTKVVGDPDHPYTRGMICPKMLHYERTVHSPRRLTTPLKRRGPKGTGDFIPISWDEAVKEISGRWREIIKAYGAEAILPYSYAGTMGLVQRNCGHAFFHRLGASRLERTICSPAKDAGWKAVMGDTPACHPDDILQSDLVILWGINAAATSIHCMQQAREAQRRGAKLWVIDTYETPTAAAADQVILVRPGSDGALALGMMHVLARDGLADGRFIADYVSGYQELEQDVLPGFTPEVVGGLTGLSPETVTELSHLYGRSRAPFIRLGSGLSRYGNGAMTIRAITCLPAVSGAYGRPGGGLFPGTSTGGAFAMAEVTREDFITAPTRIVNMNRLGHALNELQGPPVMSLYVYHSNPAAITPDQNAVLGGLAREDLFTVVHERFLTDTARYADIVLPATTSMEHSDIYRSYGNYCIQRARAVLPPLGASRSNWEVFRLLAEGMGFTDTFFHQSADDLIDRLISVRTPLNSGIDRDTLDAGTGLELPVQLSRNRYLTASGRIEIRNLREPQPLPTWLPTHEEEQGYPLRLMTAPNPFALNSSFYEQDELRHRQKNMSLLMNPADAASRGLGEGDQVAAWNDLGRVDFVLEITTRVPAGIVVAEGVWWLEFAPGERSVNALTSQRLTDRGNGSTFYDNQVEVGMSTSGKDQR